MPDADHMQAAQNNRDNGDESLIDHLGLDPLEHVHNSRSDTRSDNIFLGVGKTLDNVVNYVGHKIGNAMQQIGNAGHYLVDGITIFKHPHRMILVGTLAAVIAVNSNSLPIPANVRYQPQQTVTQIVARKGLEGRIAQSISAITDLDIRLGNVAYADSSAALDWDMPNGHVYMQANGQGGLGNTGFIVKNDANGNFWTEFKRLGGVQSVGYPISQPFEWKGFKVQAFQKLILQWRPELGVAYAVNTFDEMSNADKDSWLYTVRMTPPSQDWSSDAGKPWPEIEQAHLRLLEQNPNIKAAYYSAADPINVFGLPMGYAKVGDAYVLRAQRAVFQQWLIDVPWARAGQVVIANGGDIAKESGVISGAYLNPLVVQGQQPQPTPQPTPSPVASTGIEITGPPDFQLYINDALNVLKTGNGEWYGYVDEVFLGITYSKSIDTSRGGIYLKHSKPPTKGSTELLYSSKGYRYVISPESGVNKNVSPYHAARILVHEAEHEHAGFAHKPDSEDQADAIAKQAVCEIASINRNQEALSYFKCSSSQK